jgi:uncharacterized caspase-like protein
MDGFLVFRRATTTCAVLFFIAGPASAAEERVALVIGNAAYTHTARLRTPANDAKLVANTLREIGFSDVQEHHDVDMAEMSAALETFGKRAEGADWAVIYYAGHGLEVAGTFYLAPTGALLASANDLERETIKLGRVLAMPSRVQKLRLVILDMPRTNPFGLAARSRGTTKKDPVPEEDILLAFAAQPGNALVESGGDNGAYALALVRSLVTPGADIRDVFDRVRMDVLKATNFKQVPWTSAKLSGDYQFVPALR